MPNPTELEWTAHDGERLAVRIWESESAHAVVVFVHGAGDHGGRFDWAAKWLNGNGLHVVAADWRGHGNSSGRRGFVREFSYLVDDLETVIDQSRRLYRLPVFVYAQSLGAIVSGLTLIDRQPDVAGSILSSPAIRLAFAPPQWKIAIGRLASRVFPRMTLSSDLNLEDLSRDPAAVCAARSDPLRHDRVSPGMYFGMVDGGNSICRDFSQIQAPVMLMHGDADGITDHQATIELATQHPDNVTLQIWPGAYHELHHDICRQAVMESARGWISGVLAGNRIPV